MQISAFVDGELPDAEADLLLRRMSQDAELRRQAADYLDIGRAMRGEPSVRGVERLQERINAALDDRPLDDVELPPDTKSGGRVRPLVGIAVAASVALVALFGLQLSPGVDSTNALPESSVAADEPGYTVPQPVDEQLRQYYLSHGASSSEAGANGINARLVSLRLSEEAMAEEEEDSADEAEDDTPTQP
jgi:negative regulator of sigma E activity